MVSFKGPKVVAWQTLSFQVLFCAQGHSHAGLLLGLLVLVKDILGIYAFKKQWFWGKKPHGVWSSVYIHVFFLVWLHSETLNPMFAVMSE